MLEAKREEFRELFADFVAEYLESPDGQRHVAEYESQRAEGRRNLDEIVARRAAGQDVTNDVLLKLLPYADSSANRESGAWVHVAPSIQGDLRLWFENKGWTKPEDWPQVAQAILAFTVRCRDHADQLTEACQEFAALPYSRGFQTGFLTPILNAVNPDLFLLINNKPRRCVNYFCGTKHGQPIIEYPATNATALALVQELGPDMHAHTVPQLRDTDLFDMFCHWLVAVRKHQFRNIRYWKIAPGDHGWNWDACRDGGFIAIGWTELGDIAGLTREEFGKRLDNIVARNKDWTKAGANQVWSFAHDIAEGDQVVANNGTTEVLGIGTVTGGYYFVPEVQHGHHLPVEWGDTTRRRISQGGWRRTLVALNRGSFDAVRNAPPISPRLLAEPLSSVFRDWDEALWAFGVLRQTVERWGLTGPTDPRFALTLRPLASGKYRLRLTLGGYAALGFSGPATAGTRMEIALLAEKGASWEDSHTYHFRSTEPRFGFYHIPLATVRSDSSVLTSFWETLDTIRPSFGNWKAGLRTLHRADIAKVLFEPERLDALLAEGVPVEKPQPPFFSERAFDLMAGLGREPSKGFYDAHRPEFKELVEERLHALFMLLAQKLPDQAKAALETESGLFSRILKNDFGRGGAWPWYWGAFYPKGGKRISDAQLIVSIGGDDLLAGFMLGEYSEECQELFRRNVERYRKALQSWLIGALGDLPVQFGDRANPAASLDAWLAEPRPVPEARVTLSRDEVLETSADDLVETISGTFAALFPLVLLATEGDPLPAIERYLGIEPPPPKWPIVSIEQLSQLIHTSQPEIAYWLTALERKKQAILYGPPGTGKTFIAKKLAEHIVGGTDGFVEIVQFHPAYAYEDFIQGIRPQSRADGGGLDYPVVSGRFLQFCSKARGRDGPCVLIVDEINRANLARVFGELMYLLEYREEKVPLAADGTPFSIPANVRILGTMNTADRSIALVDHALRRRFAFIPLAPDYDVLSAWHTEHKTGFDPSKLIGLLRELNGAIGDANYHIGISFFLVDKPQETLSAVWQMEIEPYLEEYFFSQHETVAQYRWDKVQGKVLG